MGELEGPERRQSAALKLNQTACLGPTSGSGARQAATARGQGQGQPDERDADELPALMLQKSVNDYGAPLAELDDYLEKGK